MRPSSDVATCTRSSLAALLLAAALIPSLPNRAAAGPVELLTQVALHPTDSKVIVLRHIEGGHGVIYSRDGGESWRLMCLSAISDQIPAGRSGPIMVTGDGHVMMAVYQGLFVDDGEGCGWTRSAFIGDKWVTDLAHHPSDPAVTFTATAVTGDDMTNGVIKRDADGEFSAFGVQQEVLVTQLNVAERDDGLRFYERVLKGNEYLLRYSDDERETFTEFPFSSTEGNLGLQAVDPTNPDRVVAVLDRSPQDDEVLVSDDRGETFRSYMTLSQFSAIELLPSGRVYVGEAGSVIDPSVPAGLWVADSLDEEPEKLAGYPVQCLAYQESTDTLFACQYRTFGKVDQESGDYAQLFRFQDVEGFVECGQDDVASSCEDQLCVDYCTIGHFPGAPLCDVYTKPNKVCGPCAAMVDQGADVSVCFTTAGSGAPAPAGAGLPDGGSSDSGADGGSADGGEDEPDHDAGHDEGDDDGDGCSCSSVGAGPSGTTPPIALGVLLGLALLLRRRRWRGGLALFSVSVALGLAVSSTALAGPVEQLAQVALHPTDSKVIVLRYLDGGDGLFYSRDAGESWQLICRSAISKDVRRGGPIAVTGDGQVLMGVFEGLFVDDTKGCGWSQVPLVGEVWTAAITLHPTDPEVAFASTSRNSPGVLNGVFKRDENGEFSEVGIKEELLVTQVRVVEREDGLRFYERVLKGADQVIRYSDDERATFTEHVFAAENGASVRIEAVDPANPDRIVAVLDRRGADDDVLVSDDRGETFRLYMTVSQSGGIVFLPSGKIYIAEAGVSTEPDSGKGLWVTGSFDDEPTKLGDYPAACVAYQESTETLFVCQYRTFGKVDQESGAYSELFNFFEVEDFVDCEGDDVAATCETQLCVDYCGRDHFARAPVCDGYTDTGKVCGPCAAKVDEGADESMCLMQAGSGAAGSTTAGSGGAGAGGAGGGSAGTGAAGRTASAGMSAPSTGGEGRPPAAGTSGNDDDGGCSCSTPGATGGKPTAPVALSALIGLAMTLRRRRAHRGPT